jgi:hypothetical protein
MAISQHRSKNVCLIKKVLKLDRIFLNFCFLWTFLLGGLKEKMPGSKNKLIFQCFFAQKKHFVLSFDNNFLEICYFYIYFDQPQVLFETLYFRHGQSEARGPHAARQRFIAALVTNLVKALPSFWIQFIQYRHKISLFLA